MNDISFLLDENITPMAETYLNAMGYRCKHIVTMGLQGSNDEKVLKVAKDLNSCLCTMNGKDFVVQVIPRGDSFHPGLFWVIDNVTRKNYTHVFDLIIQFIESTDTMKNKIIKLHEDEYGFKINQYYPVGDFLRMYSNGLSH